MHWLRYRTWQWTVIEELGEVVDDHDTIVNILTHVQNPCIQVTATQEKAASTPRFPRNEEAMVKLDAYVGTMEDLVMRQQYIHGETVATDASMHKP